MDTINNEQFGKFLSELRKEKGLTQNQLAQCCIEVIRL